MVNTSVKICDLVFDNPIIPASGTVGFGEDISKYYDPKILGSIAVNGVTMEQRLNNPATLINDEDSSVLSSIEYPNPGVYNVVQEKLPALYEAYGKKIIANVCGATVNEYVKVSEVLDRSDCVGIIELNSACRNIDNSGIPFGANATSMYKMTEAVKLRTRKPVFVKLTPCVTDICVMAKAAQDGGADGVTVMGSMRGMYIDLINGKPELNDIYGRYSAGALKPIAVKMIYDVYDAIGIPIIGSGGVCCAEDVLEMMYAGASLVEVGAGNLLNPYCCKNIVNELPRVMKKYNVEKLSEIIGKTH